MIPKKLHFIWVGDESKRPDNCIATWRDRHPGWEIKLWGNAELSEGEWVNAAHLMEMFDIELNGVADMMRWEILYREGGIVLDADSICLRPLDEQLLDCEAFACWENEMVRPGLIAAGYFGAVAENPFVGQIILDIQKEASVIDRPAWESVGPQRLTDSYRAYQYHGLRIYPSHYFIPEHFSGTRYDGPGPVYAHQLWGSTRSAYDDIHRGAFDLPAAASAPATPASTRGGPSIVANHDPYFVQQVQVSSELVGVDKVDAFRSLCEGGRVLHIGCADWPITDPDSSLHLAIEPYCARLDGFDIHEEALAGLAPYTRGRLFSRFEDITDEYDVVLVPEVMEHVAGVEAFLRQLGTLRTDCFLITVPDAYQCQQHHFEYAEESETFFEAVHPDHNCWYTPFTFSNTLAKYTDWQLEKMWFFNGISLMALMTKTQQRLAA
jgi:mannosyltransferase OCH1-like enzyme